MFRPTSDIQMEDGDQATTDQYFPDFGGLHAVTAFDDFLITELAIDSFEQLPERHHGMLHPSSTNLLLPLDQFSVPERHMLESDISFMPDMSRENHSTWMYYDTSIPAFDSSTSTLVDTPGYDGFPLHTICYGPTSYYHPAFHGCQPNGHDFTRQATCNSESNVLMALASSADHGWPRPGEDTTELGQQPISYDMPSDPGLCFLSPRAGPFLTQPINSTASLPPTWSRAWSFANYAPVQLPLRQESTSSFKRKMHTPDDVHQDIMIRDQEQRISKRARIPPSSVNIVSFESEEKFRITREPRTGSEKENILELALLGGSCTRCEHAKKRCEKQTPCAGCVKFWTRDWNKSLSKAKRAGSASVLKLSVVAKRAKHVLAHIYNKMNALRGTTSNLPKLLSILDILTPNERRFLRSVLGDLQPKAIKDLGCYSYIIRIILGTVTRPDWFSKRSLPNEPLKYRFEHNLMPMCCQEIRDPYFNIHTAYVSKMIGHTFGRSADVDSLYRGPRDLEMKNTARLFKDFRQSFKLSLLQRLHQSAARNDLNLHPLCPHLFELVELIKHAAKDVYNHETCVGSYKVSVICRPAIPDDTTGVVVPFIVSRLESASGRVRKLQAAGWLMCSSLRDADSASSFPEAEYDIQAARLANDHWLTRLNLGTTVKLELKRLETGLELELNKLERRHGTCRCKTCMPL